MCFNMCARCRYNWGRVERAHGGVFESAYGGGRPQFCLPRKAHVEFSLGPTEVHQRNPWILHFFSLRMDREQHVPDSSNHSLYLIKLFSLRNLDGNFGENRQPDGSISLSSPPPSSTRQHTTHRDTETERDNNPSKTNHCTSDTFHDVWLKKSFDFSQWFHVSCYISDMYIHTKTCHREWPRTPQHSTWNLRGCKQATAHAHVRSRCM